jgi:uncharacterized protein (DUF2147 family)
MKRKILLVFALFIALSAVNFKLFAQVDKMVGLWKTIDDEKNEEKSYVKIYKATNGFYYGKVEKLLKEPQDKKCEKCVGELKDKPIVGMIILLKMKADGANLTDGKIMDPGNGKFYHCTIEIDSKDPDKLVVRGSLDSWGVAGRTQYWYRVK